MEQRIELDEFSMNSTNYGHGATARLATGRPAVDVAVIVPTRDRAPSLAQLLDSLCHQQRDSPSYEVVVVDNGSSDRTPEVVADYRRKYPVVRYLFEPRPGASNARNRGIASTDAGIFAFIDDDVRAAHDWIAAIAAAFLGQPEIDCLGGRIEPLWPRTPPTWLTPAHWGPLALQRGRGTAPYIDADHASACLVTANFACRSAVFRDIGLFSPAFLRDEDREFNLRMWAGGKRGAYVDSVVAFADVQPERLEKRYHRKWHSVTGASHGRLRFREIVDRQGRLAVFTPPRGREFLGAPAFLYRELLEHAARWFQKIVAQKTDDAFLTECRIRYLVNYLATRRRSRREPIPPPPRLEMRSTV
jgi:glycosyltransferase involved in cell wall biosynthesis